MQKNMAEISALMARSDFDGIQRIAASLVAGDALKLHHPFSGVETVCWSSAVEVMDNILFFADEGGQNRWLLVQRENLADAVITTDRVEYLVTDNTKSDLQKRLTAGALDHHFSRRKPFGGYVVSSTRPFHYLYDQLINLEALSGERTAVSHTPQSFIRAKHLSAAYGAEMMEPEKFYVYPTIMGGTWRKISQSARFYSDARRMEQLILRSIPAEKKRSDFTLWLSISGQKRSWIEQIEGSISLINTLASKYQQMHVVVDGLTASEGAYERFPEEEYIADEIRSRVAGRTTVRSVIGEDYPTKIALCQSADLAITDTGTGSMVPSRICGVPTVMHGLNIIDAFANDPEPRANARYVRDVVDAPHPDFPRGDFTSYHLHWQHIFNAALEVFPDLQSKFEKLQAPSNQTAGGGFEAMGAMHGMLKDGVTVADMLMFIARYFQKDPHVARAIVKEAVLHRQGTNRDAITFLNKLRQ